MRSQEAKDPTMIQLAPASYIMEHSAFERVRRKLMSDPTDRRLEDVLAHWVRPTDRSLPLAFLGRTLNELLVTPFQQLQETRGVGPKKIACLIELLERAAGLEASAIETSGSADRSTNQDFKNPSAEVTESSTTEAIWDQWRAAVMAHGLGSVTLGRLANSLHDLPRPMWHTPLANYVNLTLEETNRLHTHGERRLSAILQIFHDLYELLGAQQSAGHLCVTVESKLVRQLGSWTKHWLDSVQSPDPDEVRRGFVTPIVEQLQIDAGDSLAEMAITCIGKTHPGPRILNMSQGRPSFSPNAYYLDKMRAIVTARWAEGAERVDELAGQLEARNERSKGLVLLRVSLGVFFGPACEQFLAAGTG
jgi:hypothetical protein